MKVRILRNLVGKHADKHEADELELEEQEAVELIKNDPPWAESLEEQHEGQELHGIPRRGRRHQQQEEAQTPQS